jgi:hypothetical protein
MRVTDLSPPEFERLDEIRLRSLGENVFAPPDEISVEMETSPVDAPAAEK